MPRLGQHLAGPIRELFARKPALLVVALGGCQHGETGERPDPAGPGDRDRTGRDKAPEALLKEDLGRRPGGPTIPVQHAVEVLVVGIELAAEGA